VSRGIPQVAGSLKEALQALDRDRDFLKVGGVFTDDLIDGFIKLKEEEVEALETTPQPIEFKMYYGV
jgi:glutamine synthetase